MERERPSSPARSGSSAGVAARAILATSTGRAMWHAAGAAKVGLALTRRRGHVVVTAPDGSVATGLMQATESQLGDMRLVREPAGNDQVERLLRSLRATPAGERAAAIVADADRLSAASLERLHAGLDPDALERGDVRLVLVGGPELRRTLRDARLGDLMAQVCLHLDVPAADDAVVVGQSGPPGPTAARRRRRMSPVAQVEVVGLAAVIVVGLVLWTQLDATQPKPRPDAVAAPPPATARVEIAPLPAPAVAGPPSTATSRDVSVPTDEPPTATVVPAVAARPEAETPRRSASVPPGLGLQVGAFASIDNARRLAARLRPRFDHVEVTKIARGTRTLHRVRIGSFTTEAARRDAARRLAAEGLESLRVR